MERSLRQQPEPSMFRISGTVIPLNSLARMSTAEVQMSAGLLIDWDLVFTRSASILEPITGFSAAPTMASV
jgi:hypothetical protein